MTIELDREATQICGMICYGFLILLSGLVAVAATITLIAILFTNNVTPVPMNQYYDSYPYPYEMIMNILMTFYILFRIAIYFFWYHICKKRENEPENFLTKKWHSLTQNYLVF